MCLWAHGRSWEWVALRWRYRALPFLCSLKFTIGSSPCRPS
ncbi:hypothetical protein DESC_730058 [Desulfosarcina cetonica]|nr:hypothetical protein DESC_730058 [Desulfosarcina cetonica]